MGGIVVVLVAAIGNAVMLRYSTEDAGRRIAHYAFPAADSIRYLSPGQEFLEPLIVRNDSSTAWEGKGFGLAFRWYRVGTGEPSALMEGATFASDVLPGEERKVEVMLKTPAPEGEYTVVWFIFRRHSYIEEVEHSSSTAQIIIIHDAKTGPARFRQGKP